LDINANFEVYISIFKQMKQILTCVISLVAVLSIIFSGCGGDDAPPCAIKPIYKYLAEYSSMSAERRDSFVRADEVCLASMFGFLNGSAPSDSILEKWSESPQVKVFTPAVDSVYGSLDAVETDLGDIIYNATKYGFKLPYRHFAAVVWGNMKSIVLTDTCVLIALNHYLGADYAGYESWPKYIRSQKAPEQLPYDVAEALVATEFPYRPGNDATLLSRMCYEGALVIAKDMLVSNSTQAGALGYTEDELQWLERHHDDIWNRLVAKELLYTTSPDVVSRLVDLSPGTSILGSDVPGRAGRFLGYNLVKKYMQRNPDTTIPSLLEPSFYNNPAVMIEK